MIDMGLKKDKAAQGPRPAGLGAALEQLPTMTVGALERALLKEFPAADAEAWDRTGMTVGDRRASWRAWPWRSTPRWMPWRRPLMGANVLVTHHPAFLQPPDSFSPPPRWRRTPAPWCGPPWRGAWRCCRTTRRST